MKLEIGYNHGFEVRRETLAAPVTTPFSVLYLSDLHFNGFCKSTVIELISKVNTLNPDVILLGGDYTDTRSGLKLLDGLLKGIAKDRPVFAVAGNHDSFYGLSKIGGTMLANNVTWLEDTSVLVNIAGNKIRIDGGKPVNKPITADFNILFVHRPVNFYRLKDDYQLIFAGHLHGCQFVLWQTAKGLYPGRFFYKWNILKAQTSNCCYLISKGMGDTLPVRYNCKKDIIFVAIQPL